MSGQSMLGPRFTAEREAVIFQGKVQRHRWVVKDHQNGTIEEAPDGRAQAKTRARKRNESDREIGRQLHHLATVVAGKIAHPEDRACLGCKVIGGGHQDGCAYDHARRNFNRQLRERREEATRGA